MYGGPNTNDKLHLTNFIDRIKLEHTISKSIRAEIPFVLSFILVFVFLFLERPNGDFLSLLLNVQKSMQLDAIQGIRSFDEAISAIKNTQAKISFPDITTAAGSTVVRTTATFLSFGVFPTKACTGSLTSKYHELWASSGLIDLVYADVDLTAATPTGVSISGDTPLRCLDLEAEPSSAAVPSFPSCDAGVLEEAEGGMRSFGVVMPCEAAWEELVNTSKYGNHKLRFAMYGAPSEFLAVVTVKFSFGQEGVGDVSYSISALPSMTASSRFALWRTLGIIGSTACFLTFLTDTRRTFRMSRLKPGKYRLGVFSYKQFLSLGLLAVALSRLLLHFYIFDHFALLRSFYANHEYGFKALHSLYAAWDRLIGIYSALNLACLIACVLCSNRVLEIPHAHPRIAMLTETFSLAKTQLLNFAFILMFVMCLFAVVANLLLKNSDFQRRFATVYKVMKQQSNILVGVWPFEGSLDNYNSFLNVLYLIMFGFLSFFVLIAFYQVILVENFKRYKLKVEENVTENSFFSDALSMLRQHIKSRYTAAQWPHRLVVIGILEMLRDQSNGSSDHVEFGVFAERLSWLQTLTVEDVESSIMRDPGLKHQTKINLKKCILRNRHTKYDPLAAGDVWAWYASQFAEDVGDFLNPAFSLDAHRPALRCKQVLRDLEIFRIQVNDAMLLMHKLTRTLKDASATVNDRTDSLRIRSLAVQAELDRLRKQLDEVAGGAEARSNKELGADERLLLGLIRVIQDQNRLLQTEVMKKSKSVRFL